MTEHALNTFTATVRTDLRKFATIVQWLRAQGIFPATKSQVLKLSLDCLVESVRASNPELVVGETEAALGYLAELGLIEGDGGRARRQVAKAIALEAGNMPGRSTERQLQSDAALRGVTSMADEVAQLMASRAQQNTADAASLKNLLPSALMENQQTPTKTNKKP